MKNRSLRQLTYSALAALLLAAGIGILGVGPGRGQPVPVGPIFQMQADGSAKAIVPFSATLAQQRNEPIRPGGRLTLTSGAPVTTATQTGVTSLFYAAYNGNSVPVYAPATTITQPPTPPSTTAPTTTIAAYWQNLFICAFPGTNGACQLTLALGSNWPANTVFDVFAEDNLGGTQSTAGVNTNSLAELCTVAWSSTTARATALAYQDGILTNAASATCRVSNAATVTLPIGQGTYLGTFLSANATGQITFTYGAAASGGTAGNLSLWNYYNRVPLVSLSIDNGTNYTYTSNTIREARGGTGMAVQVLIGVIEDAVMVTGSENVATVAAASAAFNIGIGVGSTTAYTAPSKATCTSVAAVADNCTLNSAVTMLPTLGVQTFTLNENGDNANANTVNTAATGGGSGLTYLGRF